MSRAPWSIWVEGKEDQAFIESLLQRNGRLEIEVHRIEGGVGRLHKVAQNIRRQRDKGRRIALVLDADRDVDARRREVRGRIAELSLPIDDKHVFLLPDNRRAGNLEALLEELAVAEHRAVYDCLDAYRNCLKQASDDYQEPGRKGRIYAYCEALDVEPRGPHRDYLDRDAWDLSAPAIEPLRSFLVSLR